MDTGGSTTVDPNAEEINFYVDFEHRALGPYKEADLRADFNVNVNGYNDTVHGPDYNSTFIANDPVASGRGRVLEITRTAGRGGMGAAAGGASFRADFPAADEYYFAYDTFVHNKATGGYDFWYPLQEKQPSLITGTKLQSSHPGDNPSGDESGLLAFNAGIQFMSGAYSGRGTGGFDGYGVTTPLFHNVYTTCGNPGVPMLFWDIDDPTNGNPSHLCSDNGNPGGTYYLPSGSWITVEVRVKLNTADATPSYNPGTDLQDGLMEVWVSDASKRYSSKKVFSRNMRWRVVNTVHIDGIFFYDYYGGNVSLPENRPPHDQSRYYDNFVVSTKPITH